MKYLRNRINSMSIRKKIISCTYVIITPLLLVICAFLTAYRYSAAQEEYRKRQEHDVSGLAVSLDLLQQEVSYLSLNLAINYEISEILTSKEPQKINKDPELWLNRTPIGMMEEIIYLKGYVKSFSIYPENGVYPYLRCLDTSAYVSDIETLRQSTIYKQTISRKGQSVWIQADKGESDIYQSNRSKKLVLCREVFDLAKKRKLGFLTIGISEKNIRELCEGVLQSKDESVILLNHAGQIIGSYGAEDEEAGKCINKSNLLENSEYSGNLGKKQIFLYKVSEDGCYVCKIVPKKSFFQIFNEISYMPLVLMAGVLLGLLPVMIFVSAIISRPLEDVCAAMRQFEQGDFSQQLELKTKDEVGQVAACFNHMVKDMGQLINKNYIMVLKERESELAVLQAQINPHFLYNALDSIYWQAISAEDEAAAESIYELSQLFRLVLGQGKKIVTVEMEAELIQRYLEIQKLRFLQQMEYCVKIAPDILYERIPKLILQPFVENAVIHGMENKEEICTITVTGRRREDMLEFQVSDTGVGMTQEQLKRIWEEDTSKVFSGQKIGRYAIKNVKERLELKYGSGFFLDIDSEVGKGTVVTLVIPADIEEEEYGSEVTDSGR